MELQITSRARINGMSGEKLSTFDSHFFFRFIDFATYFMLNLDILNFSCYYYSQVIKIVKYE